MDKPVCVESTDFLILNDHTLRLLPYRDPYSNPYNKFLAATGTAPSKQVVHLIPALYYLCCRLFIPYCPSLSFAHAIHSSHELPKQAYSISWVHFEILHS